MTAVDLYKEMALKRDLPERGLRAGDIGTVVELLPHATGGPRGVMLEIFNALGESIDVVTIPETDVEPLRADEVFHVRSLSKAG